MLSGARSMAAIVVAAGVATAACGTPRPGESLPPVGIVSDLDPVPPEVDDADEVFIDHRTATWEHDSAVTPPARSGTGVSGPVVGPPDASGNAVVADPIVVPTSQPVIAVDTLPPPDGPADPAPSGGAGPAVVAPDVVPSWPPYTVAPGLTGVAALTGWPAPDEVAGAPVLAVKIDNISQARPQWQLDHADVVFEENVEATTRFLALFHADMPAEVGPVRSARTTDIDVLAAMNRPVLAWSGGNPGVTEWVEAAADAGLLTEVAAVRNGSCYRRDSGRAAPNNLIAATSCVIDRGAGAGPARPLWRIDAAWSPAETTPIAADASFELQMDGVRAGWTWDPTAAVYLRSQDGQPHLAASGARISATNVVEIYALHVPSPVDVRSPHVVTVGAGAGVIHRDGTVIPVSWSRPTPYDAFTFTAADGSDVALQVGRTFVELLRIR